MPKTLHLTLSLHQRSQLLALVKSSPKPYLRERASALLKIADGASARKVARDGLLRKRKHSTISSWLKRYLALDTEGLLIKPGRGRKPAFSARFKDSASAQELLLHVVHQQPQQFSRTETRWTLAGLRSACDWLQIRTDSGMHRMLKRLRIHFKRGRLHIHSPDPNYLEKLRDIQQAFEIARQSDGKMVLLFADQLTFYRQPCLAKAYELAGKAQPLAELSCRSNTACRVGAAVNAVSGQVTYVQASKIGRKQLVKLYEKICRDYPQAERIWVVLDNWPVHFHPDVLAQLEPQQTQWGLKVPSDWPSEPTRKVKRLNLPIQMLPLPTYASWANPIEKLWKHLKQYCLHMHRLADGWDELKKRVGAHLDQFKEGSQELLRYIGLTANSKLYGAILSQNSAPT